MSSVSFLIEFTINNGELEAFKGKANEFISAVQEGEPGTLVYQWWIGEDGTHCLLQERFENSEALLTHLGNVGPRFPELLATAPITRFEVVGTVSEQARTALADLGVKHFLHLAGFER